MGVLFGETGMTELKGFDDGFWHGAFEGLFHLVLMVVLVGLAGKLYRRYRDAAAAKQRLITAVDEFTTAVYKPRKLYQRLLARTTPPPDSTDAANWAAWRNDRIEHLFEEFVAAIGRFRSLQVNLVELFGHDPDLFGYYLAIWRYLKEVRDRMERRESLFFHHETPQSVDAFYRLIDSFRHRIGLGKVLRGAHVQVRPPFDVLQALRNRGDAVYREYFEPPKSQKGKEQKEDLT
jgi:hypothetical protein